MKQTLRTGDTKVNAVTLAWMLVIRRQLEKLTVRFSVSVAALGALLENIPGEGPQILDLVRLVHDFQP